MIPQKTLQPLLASLVTLTLWSVAPVQAVTLNPTADAYVRSGVNQTTNYGNATTLEIKKSANPADDFNREIYFKFDLSGVTSIRTAKLRLYGSAGSPEVVTTDLYSATNTSWTETGLTWANKPATGPVMWATRALQNSPAWHEWDVSQFLQGEKTLGRNVVTLVLKNSVASTTGTIAFNSRQHASNKPQLEIAEAYPWTYYEAEAGMRGTGATLSTGTVWGDIAYEARGKKTVILDANNEYVEWTGVKSASHVTVRYSIGDGQTGTLAVHVNGQHRTDLPLTSVRMRETKTGVIPTTGIVRLYDDVMAAVAVPANATIRLQKKASDSVAYHVDFLEVETAPAVGTKPDSTWVSVQQGTGSDRMAFENAISAAASGSKKVWIPSGSYMINPPASGEPNRTGYGIEVPAGVTIRGAGMWHTTITKNYGGSNRRVFTVAGNNARIQNFKCVDTITTLDGNGQNVVVRVNNDTSGHIIEGVWGEYASLVLGFDVMNVAVRDNRVRNAYKDTIHFAENASNNLVERNAIRNAGDDSVAFIAYDETGMANNTAQYNVSECSYWGRGITIGGGDGNIFRYNLVNDAARAGIFVQTEEYSGRITQFCTNWIVEKNVIVRCGNQNSHGSSGALSIYASRDTPMNGRAEHNLILAPPYHGARIQGYVGDASPPLVVYFRYNAIEASAVSGSRISEVLQPNSNLVSTPNTEL
jgi:hypothetical protein